MRYLILLLMAGSYTLIGEGCHFPGLRGDKQGVTFERPWGPSDDDAEKTAPADNADSPPPADED